MTVHQWHDWKFCECCGFVREVLVVEIGDLVEIECTECGFAWAPGTKTDDQDDDQER
jgi:uncharacterized Zn finger protein